MARFDTLLVGITFLGAQGLTGCMAHKVAGLSRQTDCPRTAPGRKASTRAVQSSRETTSPVVADRSSLLSNRGSSHCTIRKAAKVKRCTSVRRSWIARCVSDMAACRRECLDKKRSCRNDCSRRYLRCKTRVTRWYGNCRSGAHDSLIVCNARAMGVIFPRCRRDPLGPIR